MQKLLAFTLAVLAVPLALATHSTEPCPSDDPIGVIEVGSPSGATYYVDGTSGNVYQESNTVPGLQRGGVSPIVPDDTPPCPDKGPWDPDLLVF